jgi:hypothetical protein
VKRLRLDLYDGEWHRLVEISEQERRTVTQVLRDALRAYRPGNPDDNPDA